MKYGGERWLHLTQHTKLEQKEVRRLEARLEPAVKVNRLFPALEVKYLWEGLHSAQGVRVREGE